MTRGWIGVSVQAVPPEVARSMGLDVGRGVLLHEVIKGGPAENSGIRSGEVILEFDRNVISESVTLPRLVSALPVGKECGVKVLRGGKMKDLTITIGRLADGSK